MTYSATFYWPQEADTGHSVCLSPWIAFSELALETQQGTQVLVSTGGTSTGQIGLMLPRKDSPYAYMMMYGMSGLAYQTVATESGTNSGFAAAVEDSSGGVWLLGYYGDVTYVEVGGTQTPYSLPSQSASGDVFVGAAICGGFPYFVAQTGDIFTISGGVAVSVSPGFGATVASVSTDGTHLYAIEPGSANLATYTFSSQTAGTVSNNSVPLGIPNTLAATTDASFAQFFGNQVSGTAGVPVISGPVSGTITVSRSLAIPRINITDTNEPSSGNCVVDIYTAQASTITLPSNAPGLTGNNTTYASSTGPFAEVVAAAQGAVYNCQSGTGTDAITVLFYDHTGANNQIAISVDMIDPTSAVAVGGWADFSIVSGASGIAVAPAGNLIAAVNTAANRIISVSGTEPNWALTGAVSGTGSPITCAFASSGQQLLVSDEQNAKVQVFSLQAGAFVPGQVLTFSDGGPLAASPDGGTAVLVQNSLNQATVLANNLNVWSTKTVLDAASGTCVVGVSPSQFLIGAQDAVFFVTLSGTAWSVSASVPLSFKVNALATDGTSTFAVGTNGSTAYLAVLTSSGVKNTTSWTGSADAVYYEQAQIAVVDNTNNLIRTFSSLDTTLTQQRGLASVGTAAHAFATTSPSVWIAADGGIYQYEFTAPFKLTPRRAGAVATYGLSAWTTYQFGVSHDPSAMAWGTAGYLWVASLQNDLSSLDGSSNLLSTAVLAPLEAATGWNASLGISKMIWWEGGLWAASAQNEALMLVSGSAPAVSGSVAPSAPTGLTSSNITSDSITLGWQQPFTGTPPISYQVAFRLSGNGSFADFNGVVSQTSEAVSGLTASTSYDFEVTALNSVGSATSSVYTASTAAVAKNAPTAPSNLIATTQTASSVNLKWTASSGTTPIEYQVQYRPTGSTTWNNFGGQTTTTSELVTGLTFSTTYDFQVIASNSYGSATSATVRATTNGQAPTVPTGLQETSDTATTVTLAWQPSVGTSPIDYQIEWSIHGDNSWTKLPAQTATSGVVSGLAAGTSYDFEIYAYNTYGNVTSSILTVSTSTSGTVWNAHDVSGMVLSSGDLTAESSTASQSGVRSSQSRSSGKVFVEFITTDIDGSERIGLANSGWPENDVLGSDVSGIGISPSDVAAVMINGNQVGGSYLTWTAGGVLDLAIDFDNLLLWYNVNGAGWSSTQYEAATGTQTAGTSGSGPVISGPQQIQIFANSTSNGFGITVTDTIWPHAGTDELNLSCSAGKIAITPTSTGTFVNGTANNTNNINYTDSDANIQTVIQSIEYISAAAGSDTLTVQVYDENGNQATMNVAFTIMADPNPSTGVGGFDFSPVSGAYFVAYGADVSGVSVSVNFNGAGANYNPPSGFSWWDGAGGTAPSAPGTPVISNVSSVSATLTWTASATGSSPIDYQPQYQQQGSSTWANSGSPTSSLTAIVGALLPSTSYNFRVVASNGFGTATSAMASATTNSSGNGSGGSLIGQTSGTQNTGTTQPVISGPKAGEVMVSQQISIGASVTDANWPLSGDDALNIACVSGTATIPVSSTGVFKSGSNGTASFSYSDTDSNIQAAVAGLVYTAGSAAGPDSLSIQVYDEQGNNNQLFIALQLYPTSSGAPSAPTLSVSSNTSSTVSLSWTVPAYGSSLTYAAQYRKTGTSAWTAAFSTGSTTGTVTGLSAGTSYDFRVYVTNNVGVNFSNVVTCVTSTTSTLPGDPTGTVALRIADVLEGFGANCFPNAQDGNPAGAYTSTMTANHVSACQYLTASTGMGLTNRVYIDDNNPSSQGSFCTGVSTQIPSVHWSVCSTSGNQTTAQTVLDACAGFPCLAYAEGINEPNNGGVHANGQPVPVATTVAFQQFEYNRYQPQGISVAAASVIDTNSSTYEQDYYGTSLNTEVQATTDWCGHDYPNSGAPSEDIYRRSAMIDTMGWGSLPGIISEFHPLMYNGSYANNSYDSTAGYWTLCALLASYLYYKTDALIWFSMFNYVNSSGANVFPVDCGLFSNFDPTQPKPTAMVIHDCFDVCTDAAANSHTFQPSELNYTVAGLPPAWAGDGGINSGGGQQALFQGSDGTFYLFLWDEESTPATVLNPYYAVSGYGSFPDANGNIYSIDANGNLLWNGSLVTNGGGTSAVDYYNNTIYAQASGVGTWYTYSGGINGGFTQASAPPNIPNPPPVPVTVTFNLATVAKVQEYTLTAAPSGSPVPIQVLTSVSGVSTLLSREVRVMKITYGGANGASITGVTLGNNTITASAPVGTIVGAITVEMSSGSFSGTLSLSGTDAASFAISGTNLVTNASPLNNATYSINIIATESGVNGSPFTQPETLSTKRQWYQNPGMDGSFWVTPFYSTAQFDTTSSTAVALRNGNFGTPTGQIYTPGNFAQPWYVGQATDPLVTVTDGNVSFQVHVPAGSVVETPNSADNNNIGGADVSQPYLIWSISGASIDTGSVQNGSTITGTYGLCINDGSGIMMEDAVTAQPGDNNSFGGITNYELEQAVADSNYCIQHMLAYSLDGTVQTSGAGPIWPLYAVDTSLPNNGPIAQGYTIGIPASTPRPTGQTRGFYLLFDNLQQYGWFFYNVNGGGCLNIFCYPVNPTTEMSNLVTDMQNNMNAVMQYVGLLTNQSGPSTLKGFASGGTPVVSPPPPLDLTPSGGVNVAPSTWSPLGGWYPSGYNATPTNST